ncbi:hypothetical protein [Bacillus cereus]|uniref:hypothetical protein n=1 Tax=Bacillus cereus TaxID=1396 RepID=UPI0018CF31F9|nr:hypothetical protein [Bacillus cereus]MBG9716498.1 hypothetical protein [Bacillus cereus]
MRCSKCGKEGHNVRTCQEKNNNLVQRDQALWFKFDNVTRNESTEIIKNIIDLKDSIAPEARGTYVRGNQKELPDKIRIKLSLPEGENE